MDEGTTVKAPPPRLGPQNSQERAHRHCCAYVGLWGGEDEDK